MKCLLALVGMPGAGKSEAATYLGKKGFSIIRFGQLTEKTLAEKELPVTPENEQIIREQLRNEFGMAAYAIKAKPVIDQFLDDGKPVVLDGVYSWEEYTYLKPLYPSLLVIHVFAEARVRYERLGKRPVRPFTIAEGKDRDYHEIEKLHKGGPIAIADYLLENSRNDSHYLHEQIDMLLERL